MKRFRGGLVFKAHRLWHHSTLGLRVTKKKKKNKMTGKHRVAGRIHEQFEELKIEGTCVRLYPVTSRATDLYGVIDQAHIVRDEMNGKHRCPRSMRSFRFFELPA